MAPLFVFVFLLFCYFGNSLERKEHYVVYMGNVDDSVHVDLITQNHQTILDSIIGSTAVAQDSLIHSYRHGFNGFSAMLTPSQVQHVTGLPNVVSVFRSKKHKLHTTDSWDFMGLSHSSNHSLFGPIGSGSSLVELAKDGRDVIIGSLDTGVSPGSKSYSDYGMPPIPSKWKGDCSGLNDSSLCNRKLVGANAFAGDSARDVDGHGTHTSSTAAGRQVNGASLFQFGTGTAQGGASMARIAAYAVCDEAGCSDASILAAYDKGIADGVDVFTLSLGSDPPLPQFFEDGIAIGAFHATRRGIVVVTSAGNSGPFGGSVSNVAPWTITVGASTMDRGFVSSTTLGNNVTLEGQSLSKKTLDGNRMYPLVLAADAPAKGVSPSTSALCMNGSLDATKVSGKIVVCIRGTNARAEKGTVVLIAGGIGMLLCNPSENGNELVADAHMLPAVALTFSQGKQVLSYMNSTRSPVATISPASTQIPQRPAPIMAAFSSRGPNTLVPDILKPDITAPGVNVLAAWSPDASPSGVAGDTRRVNFNVISGTSMSCPHVAGIVALLKAYHPEWSPAAINSAIVTTGYLKDNLRKPMMDVDGRSATPFAFGGGHINPNAAAKPGLVYDAGVDDYVNFLCSLNYSQANIAVITGTNATCPKNIPASSDLNYPSIAISGLKGTRSISRRVTYVENDGPTRFRATVHEPTGVHVSVEPSYLMFTRKGETKSFRVKFEAINGFQKGSYEFGYLTWKSNKHMVRSPMAVLTA